MAGLGSRMDPSKVRERTKWMLSKVCTYSYGDASPTARRQHQWRLRAQADGRLYSLAVMIWEAGRGTGPRCDDDVCMSWLPGDSFRYGAGLGVMGREQANLHYWSLGSRTKVSTEYLGPHRCTSCSSQLGGSEKSNGAWNES